jgi:SAM-dependent methyltransferase
MLAAAHSHLARYAAQLQFVNLDFGRPDWVETVTGTVPFDVVVSGYAIHHQPDRRKQALYAEIFDLLKPGGLFLNIEHVASPSRWIEGIFEAYFIDSLYDRQSRRDQSQSRTDVAETYDRRPDKEANILASVEAQCAWLRAVGFEDVDCYFKVFELAIFGGRRPA